MNSFRLFSLPFLLLIFLSFAACSTMGGKTAQMQVPDQEHVDTHHNDLENLQNELAQAQSKISTQASEIMQAQNTISAKDAELSSLNLTLEQEQKLAESRRMQNIQDIQPAAGRDESLFPPNAKLGECYARVFVPHKMRTVTAQVMKKDASERIEIIPAQYETVTETVLKEEASSRLEVIPATFDWVEEKQLVKESKTILQQIPAQYETVTEKVLVRPAHVAWKKGRGPIQKIDNITGEIMCLVEEPAVYKTVSKKVLKTAARTETKEIPAQYTTVKKRIMTAPPSTRVVEIPAKYEKIQVAKLVSPASEKRIPIEAEYQTVSKKEIIEDSRMDWVSILCETNMTGSKIVNIQTALQSNGFDPGPLDGIIGRKTMTAVNGFQAKKGLLVSKYLTTETLDALGVSAK